MWVGSMPPDAQRRLAEYLSVAASSPALSTSLRQNGAACKSQLSQAESCSPQSAGRLSFCCNAILSALSDNRTRCFGLGERVSTSPHLFRTTLQVHNVRTSGQRSPVSGVCRAAFYWLYCPKHLQTLSARLQWKISVSYMMMNGFIVKHLSENPPLQMCLVCPVQMAWRPTRPRWATSCTCQVFPFT